MGPSRRRHRNFAIWRKTSGLVLVGLLCGRELGSPIPDAPSVRKRSAYFLAVRGATMNILAAAAYVQPLSTRSRESLNRAESKAALAWHTKASWVVKRFLDSPLHNPRQRPWTSKLDAHPKGSPEREFCTTPRGLAAARRGLGSQLTDRYRYEVPAQLACLDGSQLTRSDSRESGTPCQKTLSARTARRSTRHDR